MKKKSSFCLFLYFDITLTHCYYCLIINEQQYLYIISSHFHKIHDSWPVQDFIHLLLYSLLKVFKTVRPSALSTIDFVGQFEFTLRIHIQSGSSFELHGLLCHVQYRTAYANFSGATSAVDIHYDYSSLNIQIAHHETENLRPWR